MDIFRHGEKWDNFRAQVQHVMLQPSTARKYIMPLNDIANDFMDRYFQRLCFYFFLLSILIVVVMALRQSHKKYYVL